MFYSLAKRNHDFFTPFRFFDDLEKEMKNERFSYFTPSVDLYETEKSFELSFDLPGLSKNDVSISIENSTLVISGERKFEKESKGYRECNYGHFSRSFSLPENVNTEEIEAEFEKGVLKIVIKKQENAKRKEITIK